MANLLVGFSSLCKVTFSWRPRQVKVVVRGSLGEVAGGLFREGSWSHFRFPQTPISLKALLLSIPLWLRNGNSFFASYFASFVKQTGAGLVIAYPGQFATLNRSNHLLGSTCTASFHAGVVIERARSQFEKSAQGSEPINFAFSFSEEEGHHWWNGYAQEVVGVGSLKSNLIARSGSVDNHVLFISRWKAKAGLEVYHQTEQSLFQETLKILKGLGTRLRVLGRSLVEVEKEQIFFQRLAGDHQIEFVARNPRQWERSYLEIDRAALVVTVNSALGLEALGRKKKVIFWTDDNLLQPFSALPRFLGTRGGFWSSTGEAADLVDLHHTCEKMSEAEFHEAFSSDVSSLITPDPGNQRFRQALTEFDPTFTAIFR